MPSYDFRTPRLYVDAPLAAGAEVVFDRNQANYLRNVLRLGQGDAVLLFNGRDGEWQGVLSTAQKRTLSATTGAQLRTQPAPGDLHFLFAPLKHARLDYMVQKATELGVSRLRPVLTRRTMAERINETRLRANAIEAAEQCGILRVPEIEAPEKLSKLLETWDQDRLLIFADEQAPTASPLAGLAAQRRGPLAVLIGPEGGFEADERALLLKQTFVVPISLGPRIMRADTAAVAALSLVNAVLGDWR